MNSLRAKRRKPTHPGALLREDVFPELAMSQGDIADALGVSRRTISQILNEHRPITADMAIRLAKFLGGNPESWLNMQQALDLWNLEQENAKEYSHIHLAPVMA
jgi:addiction module HigA family antidote